MDQKLKEVIQKPVEILSLGEENYFNGVNSYGKRIFTSYDKVKSFNDTGETRSVSFSILISDDPEHNNIIGTFDIDLNELNKESMRLDDDKVAHLYSLLLRFYLNGNFSEKADMDEIVEFLNLKA